MEINGDIAPLLGEIKADSFDYDAPTANVFRSFGTVLTRFRNTTNTVREQCSLCSCTEGCYE